MSQEPNNQAPDLNPEPADTSAASAEFQPAAEPAPTESSANASEHGVTKLEQEVIALQHKVEELEKNNLYLKAAQQTLQNKQLQQHQQANEVKKIIQGVLEIYDGLVQSQQFISEETSMETVIEGLQLLTQNFTQHLEKYHIECIDPEGEMFNPQQHEAMTTMPVTQDEEDNRVMQVVQKGFKKGQQIIRPARVIVGKKAS